MSIPSDLPQGTKIKIKPTHGISKWHGDEGTIEKYVPFGKYYVHLKTHGRQIVDQSDLEKVASRMESLAQRVASRFVREIEAARFEMQREHYLPPEARTEKPLIPEGTDLEIWTWDGKRKVPGGGEAPVFYGAAFAGKANKPLWHYAFRSQSNRIEEIRKTIEIRKQYLETKKKQQEEKNNFVHGLKVGDIMVCSWGYEQTNIDFYQVTEVRGKNVIIREIASKIVEGQGSPTERVTAVPNHFIGEPMTKRPGGTTGHPSVKVHSFASAHLWDGKPEYQTGAAFGH